MAINITINKICLVKECCHRYDIPRSITCPEDAAQVAMDIFHLEQEAQEVLILISLNIKNMIMGVQEISRGSTSYSIVSPKEIFKTALLHNAEGIIMVHNHPSGDNTPSIPDMKVTSRISQAGRLLEIPLLDHIIVSDTGFLSIKEARLSPQLFKIDDI